MSRLTSSDLWVPVCSVVALLGLVAVAMTSTIAMIGAIGVGVLLAGLVTLGTERLAMVLFAVGAILAPMNRVRPVDAVEFVTASDVFIVLGAFALVPVLLERRFRVDPLFVAAAGILFTFAMVSSLLSAAPFASLNGTVRFLIGAFGLPLIFMLWRPGVRYAVVVAAAFLLGNVINIVYARASSLVSFDGRRIGWSNHPNILGLCALLALALVPFILTQIPQMRRGMSVPVLQGLTAAAAGICAFGLWISGSRAAVAAAAVVFLLWPLLMRSVYAGLAVFAAGIAGLYYVAETLLSGEAEHNPVGRILGSGTARYSDEARRIAHEEAWEQIHSSPLFGAGFVDMLDAHNIYLQMLAAGGAFALAAYGLLLFAVVRVPIALGPRFYVLALPALGYVMIGPLTTIMWDRYLWYVLALPFLIPRSAGDHDEAGPARAAAQEDP